MDSQLTKVLKLAAVANDAMAKDAVKNSFEGVKAYAAEWAYFRAMRDGEVPSCCDREHNEQWIVAIMRAMAKAKQGRA